MNQQDQVFDKPRQMGVPEAPKQDRLTVQLTVHHEHCCEDPFSITPQFTRLLATAEQPWRRRVKVGPEWAMPEWGWFGTNANVGHIVFVNNAGKGLAVNPTDEEKAAIEASVVEISYEGCPPWLIRPHGGIFFAEPSNIHGLRLRAAVPGDYVMFYVIPR